MPENSRSGADGGSSAARERTYSSEYQRPTGPMPGKGRIQGPRPGAQPTASVIPLPGRALAARNEMSLGFQSASRQAAQPQRRPAPRPQAQVASRPQQRPPVQPPAQQPRPASQPGLVAKGKVPNPTGPLGTPKTPTQLPGLYGRLGLGTGAPDQSGQLGNPAVLSRALPVLGGLFNAPTTTGGPGRQGRPQPQQPAVSTQAGPDWLTGIMKRMRTRVKGITGGGPSQSFDNMPSTIQPTVTSGTGMGVMASGEEKVAAPGMSSAHDSAKLRNSLSIPPSKRWASSIKPSPSNPGGSPSKSYESRPSQAERQQPKPPEAKGKAIPSVGGRRKVSEMDPKVLEILEKQAAANIAAADALGRLEAQEKFFALLEKEAAAPLEKNASADGKNLLEKVAYCCVSSYGGGIGSFSHMVGSSGGSTWSDTFKDTPLYQQALQLEMAKKDIQVQRQQLDDQNSMESDEMYRRHNDSRKPFEQQESAIQAQALQLEQQFLQMKAENAGAPPQGPMDAGLPPAAEMAPEQPLPEQMMADQGLQPDAGQMGGAIPNNSYEQPTNDTYAPTSQMTGTPFVGA